MNKLFFILTTFSVLFFSSSVFAQKYEEFSVDEFYKKIDLDYGTLDENGNDIDFIFVKSELKAGKYEIVLVDAPGDLYEIKGTDMYIKFRGYYGYAGYGDTGVLVVGTSAYLSKFYKLKD